MFSERNWLNEGTNLQSSITKFSLKGIDCGNFKNKGGERDEENPQE